MKAKRIPVTGLVHLLANSFEEVIMSPMFLRQFISIHSGLYQHYCSAIGSLHLLDSRGCKNAVLESKIVDFHVSARIVKGLKFLANYVDASPKAFSARLNLDFTVSCDITRERLAVLSQITKRDRTPRGLGCILVISCQNIADR